MKNLKVNISKVLILVFTFMIVFSNGGSIRVNAQENGLVAHYTFEGNLKDVSGNNNDGNADGTINYVKSASNALGQAVELTGESDSYIEVADSDSLDLSDKFTFSAWVYKDKQDEKNFYEPIFAKGESDNWNEQTPYAFMHNSDGFFPMVGAFDGGSYNYITADEQISMQKWHMLTVSWDGSSMKFYINGVLKDTKSYKGKLTKSDEKLMIGRASVLESTCFRGKLDDLRIYNIALSGEQVRSIFGQAKYETLKKMVARYNFENNLKDSSEFHNDGTAVGKIEFADSASEALGKAALFNGESYIEVEDSDSLDLDKAFTMSAWIYKEDAGTGGYAPVFAKGYTDDEDHTSPYAFFHSSNGYCPELRFIDRGSKEYIQSSIDISMQKWTLVTATWDGSNVKFYEDGVLKETKSSKMELLYSAQKLYIGTMKINGTTFFRGKLDEIRIYNYPLNEQEVKSVYDEAKIDKSGKLVAHYKFDDGLKDSTNFHNDGTAVGNITFAPSASAALGKAAVFDGTSYIEVKDSDSLDVDTAFTMSVWLYKENAGPKGGAPILSKGESTDYNENNPYHFIHDGSGYYPELMFVNDGRDIIGSNYRMSMQKWALLTATWDGSNVKYYINGVLKDTKSYNEKLYRSKHKLFIGHSLFDGGSFYTGKLDDLRIYNYALTEQDVKAVFDEAKYSVNRTLVAHYKFDGDFKDASGNGNDGVPVGNLKFSQSASSSLSQCAEFDGTNYVEVKDSDSLDLDDSFTMSVWMYKDDAGPNGGAPILSKGDTTDWNENTPYALVHTGDGYYPEIILTNDSREIKSGSFPMSMQKWVMLTVSWDGKNIKFYLDGVLKDTQSYDTELFHSYQKLLIGYRPVDRASFYKGKMDDLRIYNYALTDSDITKLFTDANVVKENKLVAYYPFDTDLKDHSGNNNDAAANGPITYVNGMVSKGIRFNGSSYLEVKDSDSLDLDKGFTMSAWILKEEEGPRGGVPILSKGHVSEVNENTPYALFHDGSGTYPCLRLTTLKGSSIINSSTAVKMKSWYLVTATWDGKEVKYYINGTLKDTVSYNEELFHSNQKLIIGAMISGGSTFFKGKMDDLRIYNYALQDSEVKDLYTIRNKIYIDVKDSVLSKLKVKQTVKFKAIAAPSVGSPIDVTSEAIYYTSNKKIITISKGVLKVVGKGKVTLKITYGHDTITKTITVK